MLNKSDIDKFSEDQIKAFNIPANIQDKKAFLKFAAEKGADEKGLGDAKLVSEFRNLPKAGEVRADFPSGAKAVIQTDPQTNKPVSSMVAFPEGTLPPIVRVPASRSQARLQATGRQIMEGSKAPATPNVINPLDSLGVNPTALQMRAISIQGTGAAEENPFASDPSIVGSAARKLNAGINNPAVYATMTPAEHKAIEPFLKDNLGGKAFLSRRDSKLAQEEVRIRAALTNSSKPVDSLDEFNTILQSADPLVRSLVLSRANDLVPKSLSMKLDAQRVSGVIDDELLKRNAPLFLSASGDDRFGVTENQVRSFIQNPRTPDAERFFAAYMADESKPRYVASDGGVRYVDGQKESQKRFRSPGARFDVANLSDQKILIAAGAKKSDIAVNTYEFTSSDKVAVPKGIRKASSGTSVGKIAASGIDDMVRSAQQRIEEGAKPDDAVDSALAEVIREDRATFGDADQYRRARSDVVNELKARSELSIQSAADTERSQRAAVVAGALESMAKKTSENGPMVVNAEKFPDLSGQTPEAQLAAARFAEEFEARGYKSLDDYIIARMGADPNGELAYYIRDAAEVDGAERAAGFEEIDAVMTRVQNNLQAGMEFTRIAEQKRAFEDQQAQEKLARDTQVEYDNFAASNPGTAIKLDDFKSYTIKLPNGGYKQFVSPELKTIYETGDEDTKKFVDANFPASPDGRVGGQMNPSAVQVFSSAIRGAYQELTSKNITLPVRDADGVLSFRETPIPVLTDTGISLMNESIGGATKQLQDALKNAASERGALEVLNIDAQSDVPVPKELAEVMTDGSKWKSLYARGVNEFVRTGDRRKAEAAYLGALNERVTSLSQRVNQKMSDQLSSLNGLATKLNVVEGADSADGLASIIAQRIDDILADGFVDPAEFSELPNDAFNSAIGEMKAQRDAVKSDIEALERVGSSVYRFVYDKDGVPVDAKKASVAELDAGIRWLSEQGARLGIVAGGGSVVSPAGIPADVAGEVEKRFNNPSASSPRWQALAQQNAESRAVRSIVSDIGLSMTDYFRASKSIGNPIGYEGLFILLASEAGLTRQEARDIFSKRTADELPAARDEFRVLVANEVLRSRSKSRAKPTATDPAVVAANKAKLLAGVQP